jgi:hypothetical protein
MQLVLSAISAGGLVGAANQYLCLLLVSVAAKTGLIALAPQMCFMESWWFIGIVALFWLLTVAPAYASVLGPGVMNAINTVVNFISGFAVPVSAALLALASVGVIASMHPDLRTALQAMQLFDADGDGTIGTAGVLIAGGSALTASVLTGSKFLAKPAISTATGTTGAASAPIYATVENGASIVLMLLFYVLTRINPWLLVGLLAVILLLILGVLAYAVYHLWKLGKGVGRAIHLIETRPKAGLSVVAEFLVWGSGWLIWKHWNRGIMRLVFWGLWLAAMIFAVPAVMAAVGAALVAIPPLAFLSTVLGIALEAAVVVVGLYIGLRSAGGLMKTFDEAEPAPAAARVPAPSAS